MSLLYPFQGVYIFRNFNQHSTGCDTWISSLQSIIIIPWHKKYCFSFFCNSVLALWLQSFVLYSLRRDLKEDWGSRIEWSQGVIFYASEMTHYYCYGIQETSITCLCLCVMLPVYFLNIWADVPYYTVIYAVEKIQSTKCIKVWYLNLKMFQDFFRVLHVAWNWREEDKRGMRKIIERISDSPFNMDYGIFCVSKWKWHAWILVFNIIYTFSVQCFLHSAI